MDYLTIATNLKNQALTQYDNYNFNSIVEFEGKVYGASESGLFTLDDATTDNGAAIDAWFEFWIGDAGAINMKRIRAFHFGGEFTGGLQLEVVNDDGEVSNFDVSVSLVGNQQHGVRVFATRNMMGRYWKMRVFNADGSDFSVDRIDVTWNVMAGTKQRRHIEHPVKVQLTLPAIGVEMDII